MDQDADQGYAQVDDRVAEAIFRTLLYADVFDFPMTEIEIHHFLIGIPAAVADVRAALHDSAWLLDRIVQISGYWCIRGRTDAVKGRQQRETISGTLWPLSRRYGTILAHLPFVRMVALTGALAMRNASRDDDDIDYLLVTAPGRVWTARAFTVLLVRIARVFGADLCPNYVLSETALVQSRQDLFLAHELAQMVPLAGFAVYEKMRAENEWSATILPNALQPFYKESDVRPRGLGRKVQRLAEVLLGGRLGDALENWERGRKMRKFEAEAHKPGSSAQLDAEHVKGHFNDYGYPVLDKYRARLEQYDLDDLVNVVVEDYSPVVDFK